MKLRYQMRGLGIGMVVTALLMGVATRDKLPLTDAEIKAKALELGMVESDSLRLTDIMGSTPNPQNPKGTVAPRETFVPKGTTAPVESPPPAGTTAPEETYVPKETTAPVESPPPQETAAPQETLAPQETFVPQPTVPPTAEPGQENDGSGEAIAIVIRPGADSYSVSMQLAEAGLIEDVKIFDDYLCDNDYSKRISTGTFRIEPGTSEEQIAKIITRTR